MRTRCRESIHPHVGHNVGVPLVECVRRADHSGMHRGWFAPPRGWITSDVTISGTEAYAYDVAISWGREP